MASQKLPSRKGQEVPNVGEKSAQKVPSSEFTTLTVAGRWLRTEAAARRSAAGRPGTMARGAAVSGAGGAHYAPRLQEGVPYGHRHLVGVQPAGAIQPER